MALNRAVTVFGAFIVTAQVPVPLQTPPSQPPKAEPALVGAVVLGVAVSVTDVLLLKLALHVPLGEPFAMVQLMPAGLLVTVPVPAPVPVIVSSCVFGFTVCVSEPVLMRKAELFAGV
jgi:hypothetical protein